IAAVAQKRARNDETQSFQRVGKPFPLLFRKTEAGRPEPFDDTQILRIGEILPNTAGYLVPHLFGLGEFLFRSGHDSIERTEMRSQITSRRLAHEADAECIEHTGERNSAR